MANWTEEETLEVVELWSEDTIQAPAVVCVTSSEVVLRAYRAEYVPFKDIVTPHVYPTESTNKLLILNNAHVHVPPSYNRCPVPGMAYTTFYTIIIIRELTDSCNVNE